MQNGKGSRKPAFHNEALQYYVCIHTQITIFIVSKFKKLFHNLKSSVFIPVSFQVDTLVTAKLSQVLDIIFLTRDPTFTHIRSVA